MSATTTIITFGQQGEYLLDNEPVFNLTEGKCDHLHSRARERGNGYVPATVIRRDELGTTLWERLGAVGVEGSAVGGVQLERQQQGLLEAVANWCRARNDDVWTEDFLGGKVVSLLNGLGRGFCCCSDARMYTVLYDTNIFSTTKSSSSSVVRNIHPARSPSPWLMMIGAQSSKSMLTQARGRQPPRGLVSCTQTRAGCIQSEGCSATSTTASSAAQCQITGREREKGAKCFGGWRRLM